MHRLERLRVNGLVVINSYWHVKLRKVAIACGELERGFDNLPAELVDGTKIVVAIHESVFDEL